MRQSRGPLKEVVHIDKERTGGHGGKFRLCKLECGHHKAWSVPAFRFAVKPRLVPERMRCLLCGYRDSKRAVSQEVSTQP